MLAWFGRGRRIEAKLDALLEQGRALIQESEMAGEKFQDLVDQVHANESVEAAAALAIQGLVGRLEQATAIGDPVQCAALMAEMKASASALAAAIPANTPAAAPVDTSQDAVGATGATGPADTAATGATGPVV